MWKMSKYVLTSFNSFPSSSLNLKLFWGESCPLKRKVCLSQTNIVSFWGTQHDEYICQATVRWSSGLPANVLHLVGNHSTSISSFPCSLPLYRKKALAGTSEWMYFAVALRMKSINPSNLRLYFSVVNLHKHPNGQTSLLILMQTYWVQSTRQSLGF